MALFKSVSRRRLRHDETLKLTPVNKRLNFHFDADDSSPLVRATTTGLTARDSEASLEQVQFDMDLDDMSPSFEKSGEPDSFSPCRTRSGCVYESGLKKRKFRVYKKKHKKMGGRARALSGQSGTGSVADCSENGSEGSDENNTHEHLGCDRLVDYDDHNSPPPLLYHKNPVSRFTLPRERKHRHDILSSPISHHHNIPEHELSSPVHKTWTGLEPGSPTLSFSPPTNTMRAMRLFDGLTSPNTACALTSPRSTPRAQFLKSRLLFDDDEVVRRSSLPNPQILECDSTSSSTGKNKSANINPFTPAAMLLASKKRSRSKRSIESSLGSSREELQASLDSLEVEEVEMEEVEESFHAKRLRVADISISRYECEFLEIDEIASGQFGTVKKSLHRLDGIEYAIKISKKALRVNSHDEKMAMNEVFAHAAIMKHKHVVRYYNSWVEKGQVYIQNEFCEGGSLQNKIQEFRQNGGKFAESELKKIIVHVAKGLQYVHSKQLVHLDIKPGNIFIALEYNTPSPHRKPEHSTDSGAASGDHSPHPLRGDPEDSSSSPGEGEKVYYKIGDLGHVASLYGKDVSPEEGDCRYMAPEFLEMEVERTRLPKADIFSLGLTIYEAASLRVLPRNSLDSLDYEKLKSGELPYLDNYSWEFNLLLKSMVSPDPGARPSASKLLSNPNLNPSMNKTRSQLYKELRAAREKVVQLELKLQASTPPPPPPVHKDITQNKENNEPVLPPYCTKKRLVGRGTLKSTSCLM